VSATSVAVRKYWVWKGALTGSAEFGQVRERAESMRVLLPLYLSPDHARMALIEHVLLVR